MRYNCSCQTRVFRGVTSTPLHSDQSKDKLQMAKNNSTPKTIQLPLPIEDATVSILLTRGLVTIVDAIDADLLQHNWNASWYEYARRTIRVDKKQHNLMLHRVILERKLGRSLLPNEYVDHIDTDKLNNRRSNLRIASLQENNRNVGKLKRNTSGYKGVVLCNKRWRAAIRAGGKTIYVGVYDTPEEAYAAYCEASKKYHGEFSRIK